MNSISKLKESYEEEKKALDKKYEEAFQSELKKGAKALFDKYKHLESFGWPQYTPYFNDGDPCYFSVHSDDDVRINDLSEDEMDEDEEVDDESWRDDCVLDVRKLINSVPDEYLESLYGEGLVTIQRSGNITTDEYPHD